MAEHEDAWDQLVEEHCQGLNTDDEDKRQFLTQTPGSLRWKHAVKQSIAEIKSRIASTSNRATEDAMSMLKIVEREEELMRKEMGESEHRSGQSAIDNADGGLRKEATGSSRPAPDFNSEWSLKRAELGLDGPPAQAKTFDIDVANTKVETSLHI